MRFNVFGTFILYFIFINAFFIGNGQTLVELDYSCSKDFGIRPKVSVTLYHSDEKLQLLDHCKEDKKYNFSIDRLDTNFIIVIKYTHHIFFSDTIQYPFKLTGKEEKVNITIHFHQYLKWEKNAYLGIVSYFPSHEQLLIEYAPSIKSTKDFKGPFFLLKNNSNDTIFGTNSANYYWGSISYLNDSVYTTLLILFLKE